MVRYIIIYCFISVICIFMCSLDFFIDNVNHTLQRILIHLFELLSWIVFVVGAAKNIPKDRFSNKRVWFYYAIMSGGIAAINPAIKLISTLKM